ncbi:tRNA-Val4 [Bacillus mangrovi]|uniref:tRNA-Val4 n=1 Tax=Metabacillus mangrovi TaxID=1491830 RepID=A0A7X2V5T9_9BACI|nr:tRNA-Val4 [Metabacillus mangrovi]MTH54539.1 tRNA-Val4 [Metabacillus mangrovi]
MKYPYEFVKDPFGDLGIVLPEEISLFSDFIENVATEDQADEYIGYANKVLTGDLEDFEIELNATSIVIKENFSTVKNSYRIEEPYINQIETDQFIELLLIWKEKIPETFKG